MPAPQRPRPPVRTVCVNGDGRPIHFPSKVLCAECFAVLDEKMRRLGERLGMEMPQRPRPGK